MATRPAPVARPSSTWAATTAPIDAAPSLALAATVNTVARSVGGLWSLRAVNSADEQRTVDEPDDEGAGEQQRPRAESHHGQRDAHRGERDEHGRRGPPRRQPPRHRQRAGEAADGGDGHHRPGVGGRPAECLCRRRRRRRTARRGRRTPASWRRSPSAAVAPTRSGARRCRAARRRHVLGGGASRRRPSDVTVSGAPATASAASAQRRRGDQGDDGDERRPGQPGDVVGERVPGVDAGRPGTPSAGGAHAAGEQRLGAGHRQGARRPGRRTASGRRTRRSRGWRRAVTAAAARSTRHGWVARSSTGPSRGPVASWGSVATATSHPAAAVEPERSRVDQDERQGQALADQPGARRGDDEARQ